MRLQGPICLIFPQSAFYFNIQTFYFSYFESLTFSLYIFLTCNTQTDSKIPFNSNFWYAETS